MGIIQYFKKKFLSEEETDEYSIVEENEEDSEEDEEYKSVDEKYRELILKFAKEYKKRMEEEDAKYDYPIKKSQARGIAGKELKKVYIKTNTVEGLLTYIGEFDYDIEVIERNQKKYWQVQIKSGEISGASDNCEWDGVISKEDLKKLRCLIDVESGEYIYYPKEEE